MRRALLVILLLAVPAAAEPHDPIRIVSDNDFVALGASGSGTAEDPYVLEDLQIKRALVNLNPASAAVHVQGTEAHAIIRQVSATDAFDVGIRVLEARNLSFEQIEMAGQGRAFWIDKSADLFLDDVSLTGSTARDGTTGLVVTNSERVLLRAIAVADGSGPGIQLSTSSQVRVEGMSVTGHDGGLRVQSNQNVVMLGVTANANRGDGVWISNVTNIEVFAMDVVGQKSTSGLSTGRGLVAWDSTGALYSVNAQENDATGILLYNADLSLQTGHALDNGGAGIHLEMARADVADFEIHGNGGFGIEVFSPAGQVGLARLQNLHVHDNEGGLYVARLDGLDARDLRIERNEDTGVTLHHVGNFSLLSSVVAENGQHGMYAEAALAGQISGVAFLRNGEHGVAIKDGQGITLGNNKANGNSGSGMFLHGQDLRVENNQVRGNGAFGIEVLAGANATLVGNEVAGNTLGDLGDGVRQKEAPVPLFVVLAALLWVHQRTKSV